MTTQNNKQDLYNLQWNDYYENIKQQFILLKENQDFTDCTLACEGGVIKTHKLILCLSSRFFNEVLKDNPCSHPIIILKDINIKQMKQIIDYMYEGKINIKSIELDEFLDSAHSLEIKGLTDIPPSKLDTSSACCAAATTTTTAAAQQQLQEPKNYLEIKLNEIEENSNENDSEDDEFELDLSKNNNSNNYTTGAIINEPSILIKELEKGNKNEDNDDDMDLDEYSNSSNEFYNLQNSIQFSQQQNHGGGGGGGGQANQSNYKLQRCSQSDSQQQQQSSRVRATDPRPCPKCYKIYRSAHTLRTHLEDKHTICSGYRCVLCGTVAKSRNSLHSHMSRQHRGISTKDLPILPMPAPFDTKLANKLLMKCGSQSDNSQINSGSNSQQIIMSKTDGENPITYLQPNIPQQQQLGNNNNPEADATTGSVILDTYLQFIAENSILGSIYK